MPSPAYARLRHILHELERPWRRRGLPASLTAAAMAGDLESMEAFVERGADVDERSPGFSSPLQAAARSGRTEAVRWLLERGADPDRSGTYSPLGTALEHADLETLRLLLAAGAAVDSLSRSDLQMVAAGGSPARIRALVEAGLAEDHRRRMARQAETAGRPGIAAYLRGEPVGGGEALQTDVEEAPASGSDRGRRRDERAEDLIEEALGLVRGGGLDPDLDRLGHHGESLLTGFVREGLTGAALALIERGADPDAGRSGSGSRALIQAVENGEWQVFDALLDHGADVGLTDDAGRTALIAAADFGLPEVVERLLALGADPSRKARGGQTAVNQAQGPYRKEIQRLVRAAIRARGEPRASSLRVRGRGAVKGVATRRGVGDFLDLVLDGEPDWCLLLARADAAELTPRLAETRSAVRLEADVAGREIEPGDRASFVLQLAGHPISIEIRSVGGLFGRDTETLGSEAAALSRRLRQEVMTFVGSDASGTCDLTRYRDGVVTESFEWTLAGRDREAMDTCFRDLDLYLPPCRPGGDGERAELTLYGIGPKAVRRLDYLVLEG